MTETETPTDGGWTYDAGTEMISQAAEDAACIIRFGHYSGLTEEQSKRLGTFIARHGPAVVAGRDPVEEARGTLARVVYAISDKTEITRLMRFANSRDATPEAAAYARGRIMQAQAILRDVQDVIELESNVLRPAEGEKT